MQAVKGMEKFFLCRFLSYNKLNIIDKKNINVSVFFTKLGHCFALTYFVVSGELERSGVPLNLVINDAGGLSVLTSWAAGKFSGNSISSYIKENVEPKVKSRKLIIPGKVAVLKGDLEAKLPGWEIIVGPREAVQLVKFLKDLQADGQI